MHLKTKKASQKLSALHKFQRHLLGDPPLCNITVSDIQGFLAAQDVPKKTLLNYHTGLSALWAWAVQEGIVKQNIIRSVPPAQPEKPAIEPFTEADVNALLAVIARSKRYSRPGKRECDHRLSQTARNRAIVLFLLDTGLRASELCSLDVGEIDLRNHRVKVMGKGTKERIVSFSAQTGQVLWRYITSRKDAKPGDPLFVTGSGHRINRRHLAQTLARIGVRAGIADCNPHRFRHTFAINFLRNGGNAFALQELLGHSSLDMVHRYLRIVQADVEAAHRQASPVANWKLKL